MIHLVPCQLQEWYAIVCFLLGCTSLQACWEDISQDRLSVILVVADRYILPPMRVEGHFPQQHTWLCLQETAAVLKIWKRSTRASLPVAQCPIFQDLSVNW